MNGPAWLTGDDPLPDPHGKGERAVQFLARLRLTEGKYAGKRFPLARFQDRIVRRVYGDTDSHGLRRVRTVFLFLPRGNGKTTFTSGLALLHLFGPEHEPAGQVICAAGDRDQASLTFNPAARMCRIDRVLNRATRIADSRKTITHTASASVLRAISRESKTKHGLSISFLNADEIHVWPDRDLWDVLTTSMGKRENPLTVITTTAGEGDLSIAWELYSYAVKVASGEITDPTFLPVLYEAPKDCDPFDEAIWHACNPALAEGFRSLDEMRAKALMAKQMPGQLAMFKRLYLNIWSDGAADPAFDMDVYDEGAQDFDPDEFLGEPCWIGVDLSSTSDLTAVVAVWMREDFYFVCPWFFLPEETVKRREGAGKVPYKQWALDGNLILTKGNVVDYAFVEAKIIEIGQKYDVREVSMDPWNSQGTSTRLEDMGLPVVRFRQGWVSMSPAVKELERAILSRRFMHGGHPILRWNFQNVVIDVDPAGNVKFNKARSADKIDGAVAAAMAVARAAQAGDPISVYDGDERPDGFLVL